VLVDLHVIDRGALEDGPGRGRLVVMVHGAMDRATSFRRVWNHLRDFEMVAYDRRGYAGSLGVAATTDFADQVADLRAVLAGRRAIALGHSFGGNVVLATAATHPELISAAVVYEPPAPWRPEWPSASLSRPSTGAPGEQAEAFMRRMVGHRVWERLPAATREQRRAEGPTLVTELAGLRAGAPFEISQVGVPVVVGCGSVGLPYAATWARTLAGLLPRGELVEVPGATHGIHLGDPAALAAMVRSAAAWA
jgi:pimeloyl-ACP methyl ester carboxylesterase